MHPRYHVVVEPHSNRLADPGGHLNPVAGAVGVDHEQLLARSDWGAALDDHVGALVGDSSSDQDGVVRAIRAARSPGDANAAVVEEDEGSQSKPEDRERCRQGSGVAPSRPPPSFIDQPSEARSARVGT